MELPTTSAGVTRSRALYARRIRIALVAAVLLAGTVLLTTALGTTSRRKSSPAAKRGSVAAAGVRFANLSAARSNRCSLQASELATMNGRERLRGACCSAMDRAAYADQRRGLVAYRPEAVIPQDPYDIPVALARKLVGYRSIRLTAAQRASYDEAIVLAHEHGPCCCHCWRWDAFEGQADYLITERNFTGAQVAEVWDLEDGCGGPRHPPA